MKAIPLDHEASPEQGVIQEIRMQAVGDLVVAVDLYQDLVPRVLPAAKVPDPDQGLGLCPDLDQVHLLQRVEKGSEWGRTVIEVIKSKRFLSFKTFG